MRVLIACEFSGIVRDAFLHKGHEAWSCDLLQTESPGPHKQQNILEILGEGWDLMIAHPPCTYLTVAGARWFKGREQQQEDALDFVVDLLNAPIPKIALENPIGVISTRVRKPTQIVHPWWFGHTESKATCLWLKGLPKLTPTQIVTPWHTSVHHAAPGSERWKKRSRTFKGLAEAMAQQWGT